MKLKFLFFAFLFSQLLLSQNASIHLGFGHVMPDSSICIQIEAASPDGVNYIQIGLIWDNSVIDLITKEIEGVGIQKHAENNIELLWSRNTFQTSFTTELCFRAVGDIGEFSSVQVFGNGIVGNTNNPSPLNVKSQSGFIWIGEDDEYHPPAICRYSIDVELVERPTFTLLDIYGGQDADITRDDRVFEYGLTFRDSLPISPHQKDFSTQDEITLSRLNVCDKDYLELHVWNERGLRSSCLTKIIKNDPTNRCLPLQCRKRTVFLKEDESLVVNPEFFISPNNFRELEDLDIEINDVFQDEFTFTEADTGVYDYVALDTSFPDECMSELCILPICEREECLISLELESKTVLSGDRFLLTLSGEIYADTSEIGLGFISIPLNWNPELIAIDRIEERRFERGDWKIQRIRNMEQPEGTMGLMYYLPIDTLITTFEVDLVVNAIGEEGESSLLTMQENDFFELIAVFDIDDSFQKEPIRKIFRIDGKIQIDEKVSIVDISEDQIVTIYPNPTSEHVIIRSEGQKLNGHLKVYSAIGQRLFSEKVNQYEVNMNLIEWNTGLYIFFLDDVEIGRVIMK